MKETVRLTSVGAAIRIKQNVICDIMQFIAYITKGLDRLVRNEILERVPEATVRTVSDKYVVFEAPQGSIQRLLDLKTVDDIHLLLEFEEHDEKPDSDRVMEAFPFNDLFNAVETVRSIRHIEDTISVTTSRYKNDLVDKQEIKTELGARVASLLSREFTERDHSNFDIRVHVEKNNLISSVRLTEKPLYYRTYKVYGREGSLKPSIAAALVWLTDPDPADRLVDNFCGVGTILCEGVLQGLEPYGGDIDEEAVRYASAHLRSFSRKWVSNVRSLNAITSKLPDSYYDLAVSNVPWGEQIDLNAVELYSQAIPEYARILKDDAPIVLLGPKPDLVEKHLKKNFPNHNVGQFRLGFLGQRPWVNFAYPDSISLNLV